MTKERLRRLIDLAFDHGGDRAPSAALEEYARLTVEFEAWEPERERLALTRGELLELLFRLGRLQPGEREELETLRNEAAG